MENTNHNVYRFPVSVKGIVTYGDQVLLLKNERNEWELPGGKLELQEEPSQCVEREIWEETGLKVTATTLVDLWVYTVFKNVHVLIVTYGCSKATDPSILLSNEHQEAKWHPFSEIASLNMPEGYKHSIQKWKHLHDNRS